MEKGEAGPTHKNKRYSTPLSCDNKKKEKTVHNFYLVLNPEGYHKQMQKHMKQLRSDLLLEIILRFHTAHYKVSVISLHKFIPM